VISLLIFGGEDIRRSAEIPSGSPPLRSPPSLPGESPAHAFLWRGCWGCWLHYACSLDGGGQPHPTEHNPNKEYWGRGWADVVSGLFGGIAGGRFATMGTVVNSGGRSHGPLRPDPGRRVDGGDPGSLGAGLLRFDGRCSAGIALKWVDISTGASFKRPITSQIRGP